MRPTCSSCLTLAIALAITLAGCCFAQEIGSADLADMTPHDQTRLPLAPGGKRGPRTSIHNIVACPHAKQNEATLRVTFVSLDRTDYRIGDAPRFEVTIENAGSRPLEIPFSPHLADLQPQDPAQKFGYSELHVDLWVAAGGVWSADSGGHVTLFGSDEHSGSMLNLNPGESVRIIGKGKLELPDSPTPTIRSHPVDHLYAKASLYRTESLSTASATAVVSREVCLKNLQGEGVPISLITTNQ